jgi:hypothetical protein
VRLAHYSDDDAPPIASAAPPHSVQQAVPLAFEVALDCALLDINLS